mgnify:CR=1 FL=1
MKGDGAMKAKNYAARKKAANWIVILIIFVVAVLMLIPFLWMISTSLKSRGALMSIPIEWIPAEPRWMPMVRYFPVFHS